MDWHGMGRVSRAMNCTNVQDKDLERRNEWWLCGREGIKHERSCAGEQAMNLNETSASTFCVNLLEPLALFSLLDDTKGGEEET